MQNKTSTFKYMKLLFTFMSQIGATKKVQWTANYLQLMLQELSDSYTIEQVI